MRRASNLLRDSTNPRGGTSMYNYNKGNASYTQQSLYFGGRELLALEPGILAVELENGDMYQGTHIRQNGEYRWAIFPIVVPPHWTAWLVMI